MKPKFVTDIFKQFCKERHAEDRRRNYNLLQEIYSKTELFDLSYLDFSQFKGDVDVCLSRSESGNSMKMSFQELKEVSLPFESMFVQLDKEGRTSMFIREFKPFTYTGTFYMINQNGHKLNFPFMLKTDEGCIYLPLANFHFLLDDDKFFGGTLNFEQTNKFVGCVGTTIHNCSCVFNSLPKYAVASDTQTRSEYYPRQNASTIKVSNRPIYYVLDKKEETNPNSLHKIKVLGKIEFTHAFSVRGHWRVIDEKSIGKDRNGEYKVKGYTWVKEHVRGEGELVKRIRIVK